MCIVITDCNIGYKNNFFFKNNFGEIFHDVNFSVIQKKDNNKKISMFNSINYFCLVYGDIYNPIMNKHNNTAEMIFTLFVNNKTNIFSKLDGRYLIVLYDKLQKKIYAVRDPIGFQHVFYFNKNSFFLSTSQQDLLNFLGKHEVEIDKKALDLYLTFQYLPFPYTMFTNVLQLPPSSILIKQKLKTTILKYEYSNDDNNLFNVETNYSGRIKEILTQSFKKQINNNKNIGGFLSGGMDTSSNIALLSEYLNIKPTVFTASFDEKEYDETKYAKKITSKFNLKHHFIKISKDMIFDLYKIVKLYDNPIGDRAILPEYFICKHASSLGINKMVSGEGGDEILGYPRNLKESPSILNIIKNTSDNFELAKLYIDLTAVFSRQERSHLLGYLENQLISEKLLSGLYDTFNTINPFERILYGQWNTWLIDNVLIKDNQIFQKYNMSYITPYIDNDLMTLLKKIPLRNKTIGLKDKYYLKTMMKGMLPKSILKRKKHKFHVPINEWFKGGIYTLLYETLTAKNSYVNNHMDNKIILKLLIDHKKNVVDNNRKLWILLFFELWQNNYKQTINNINRNNYAQN